MRLRIDIDDQTRQRLAEAAERERRPLDLQAEVLLRRALGLATCDCGRLSVTAGTGGQ
jgi:hypothetical protein